MSKDKIKFLFSVLSNFFNFSFLTKIVNQNIIFPFYHSINNIVPEHLQFLYPVRNEKTFEKDLDFLLKNYQPFHISELENILKLNTKKQYFHISFDDGLSDFYNFAYPILEKKGISATIFLNDYFIDNKDLFYKYKISIILSKISEKKRKEKLKKYFQEIKINEINQIDEIARKNNIDFDKYLKTKKPYLTSEQINELKNKGFTFGSHSKNHLKFSEISYENQIAQVVESIDFLMKKFQLEEKLFAFPFTDFGISKRFFEEIFSTSKIDFTFGTAGLKKDSVERNIQRIPMEKNRLSARSVIGGEYLYYIFKSFFNKNIIYR